jgi:DNA polymerase I-like protein with 3'-5' exonuclease and polymerase domains
MLTISNPKTFKWDEMSLSDCCEGNAADSYFTLKLFDLVMEKLEGKPVMKLIEHVLMPSLNTFAQKEFVGLDVATENLDSVGRHLKTKNIEDEDLLYECDGVLKTDNLSGGDLMDILYTREGGLELYPPDRTTKGKPSVSAPTLKILLEQTNEELEKRG